jgi:hypothetical protein
MPGSETELHEIPAAGLSRRPLLDARAAGRYTSPGERYIRRGWRASRQTLPGASSSIRVPGESR